MQETKPVNAIPYLQSNKSFNPATPTEHWIPPSIYELCISKIRYLPFVVADEVAVEPWTSFMNSDSTIGVPEHASECRQNDLFSSDC